MKMSSIAFVIFSISFILLSVKVDVRYASITNENAHSEPTLYTFMTPPPSTTIKKVHPLRKHDTYGVLSRIMDSRRNLILLNTTEDTNITTILPLAKQFPRLELDRTDDMLPCYTPYTDGPSPGAKGRTPPPYIWRYMPLLNISDCFIDNTEIETGLYPVIYVNLVGISSGSYARIIEWVKDRIKNAFKDHRYLLEELAAIMRDRVNNSRDEIFQAQRDFQMFFKIYRFVVTEEEVAYSLTYLSRILYNFHKKRVIMVIDRYDYIANNLTGKSNVMSDYDKRRTLTFLKHILNVITKLNIYTKKTVLIGCVKNMSEDSFIEKYNVKEYYTWPNLYQFYSFPKPELDKLFGHFPQFTAVKPTTPEEWNDVYGKRHGKEGDFYDGFNLGDFMQVKFEENVWADVFYIDFLVENALKSDLFRTMFIDVLWGKDVTLDENAAQIMDDANNESLRNHIFDEQNLENLDKHTANLIFVFLYKHKYLIAVRNATLDSKTVNLRVSNLSKIKTELSVMLMKHYRMQYGIVRKHFLDAIRDLGDFMNSNNSTTTTLKKSLERIYRSFISDDGNNIASRLSKELTFVVSQIPLRYSDYEISERIETDNSCYTQIILKTKERVVLLNFDIGTVLENLSDSILKILEQSADSAKRFRAKNLKVKLIGIHVSSNATVDIFTEFIS